MLDLEREKALQDLILSLAQNRMLASCHDTAEGGLAVAFAEACMGLNQSHGAVVDQMNLILNSKLGPYAEGKNYSLRKDALYFGETQSRVIISLKPENKEFIIHECQKFNTPVYQVGKVGGDSLILGDDINVPVTELKNVFENAIPRRMKK